MTRAQVEEILYKLQELELVRLNKITGNYFTLYCPIHKDGQERKPSCGVLLTDEVRNGQVYKAGFTHCFTCGFAKPLSDTITEILKKKNITKTGLEWLKENIPGFEAENDFESIVPDELVQAIQSKFAVEYVRSQTEVPVSYVGEEELAKYRLTVDYMYQRKLTDEIIELFDVGFDPNWIPPGKVKPVPCITFPVRDREGRTLFFCRRSIAGKMYNYPEGIEKPLYGIDMIPQGCNSVCITESCINALTLWTWGYKAVALLGTGNVLQMNQLKQLGVHNYVICTDGDDAGRRAAQRLKRGLKSVAMVWEVHMPDGKDINDLTKEEFESLYSERD